MKSNISAKNKTGKYWTSGTDKKCSGKHFWCSENIFFKQKDVNWAKDQPNNEDGECVFLTGTLNVNTSSYAKENCNKQLQYICEVRKPYYFHILDDKNAKNTQKTL
jgi:hypothetical protein